MSISVQSIGLKQRFSLNSVQIQQKKTSFKADENKAEKEWLRMEKNTFIAAPLIFLALFALGYLNRNYHINVLNIVEEFVLKHL